MCSKLVTLLYSTLQSGRETQQKIPSDVTGQLCTQKSGGNIFSLREASFLSDF